MGATRAFGLVAVALSAAIGGCRQAQDSLLYYPTSAPAVPPAPPSGWTVESLALTRPDNVELRGWFVKPATTPAPLLIYFGGNAEEISAQIPTVSRLGGRAVALVDYRGYGRSAGKPSEAALTGDALAVFDAVMQRPDVDRARVAVMGRSLGTGVAVHLAAHRPIERAVLVSPYDSIAEVAVAHFPAALVRAVLRDRYDAAALAPTVRAPLLAIAATRDETIPVENSRRLFAAWGGPKQWVELARGGHNDIQMHPEYWQSIAAFLTP